MAAMDSSLASRMKPQVLRRMWVASLGIRDERDAAPRQATAATDRLSASFFGHPRVWM